MLSRLAINNLKKRYPKGTRVKLIFMQGEEMSEGERGTVYAVDDVGNIMINWDNGRTLSLIPEVDSFRKLSADELHQEGSCEYL